MSRRKYRPGAAIRSLPLAVHLIEQGRLFYWPYAGGSPRNARFMAQQRLAVLAGSCAAGRMILAEPIEVTP